VLLITKRHRQTDGRLTVALPRSALASRGNKSVHISRHLRNDSALSEKLAILAAPLRFGASYAVNPRDGRSRSFKVIYTYWCQQKSRTDCCHNVQQCGHYFRNLRRYSIGKTANSSTSTTPLQFDDSQVGITYQLVYIGCVLFQNLTNLDRSRFARSRFVRRDGSSPMKKNTQIFLVVVGVVTLFSSAQSAADHALFHPSIHLYLLSFTSKQTTRTPGSTDGRG